MTHTKVAISIGLSPLEQVLSEISTVPDVAGMERVNGGKQSQGHLTVTICRVLDRSMVCSCCAFNCTNSTKNSQGKSFHRFPLNNSVLLSKWLAAIRREGFTPSPHSRICSDHFVSSDYQTKSHSSTYRYLKDEAVPSVFTFPEHLSKKVATRRPLQRKELSPPPVSIARIKRGVDHDHLYSTTTDSEIDKLQKHNDTLRKKVKLLHTRSRRQQKHICKLKDLLSELQSKHLLEAEPASVMEKCFDGTLLEIMKCETENSGRAAQGRRYSQEVKQFAATLHYYSPQAYEYCRTVLTLPHEASIRTWISNVECEPGFLSNILDVCSESKHRDFSLVIDSMSIKKHTSYLKGKFTGFCDYGGIVAEDEDHLCTEALVFLLVPLTFSKLQYPVGYFLVDKVNSQVQTELVKTLLHLTADKGLKIRNITCDGAAANQTMFRILGCNLDPTNPKPCFKHPCMSHNVYATLDICHMLKLARNALAEGGTFYALEGERICWQYIEDLSKLQDGIGLHLANKLTSRHVNWTKQKMKVKLAAQTFSRSVADALQYLYDSKTAGFLYCDATIEFIRQIDRAFDILNSRSKYGKGWKEAIKPENIDAIRVIYDEFSSYLLSLDDANHQPLSSSRRKTFVVGFVCTFHAVLTLADELFHERIVNYMPTFRISQDFIETLFSKIRRMGGHNNNPTSVAFRSALKSLLTKQYITASKSANCVDFDSTSGVISLQWSKRTAPAPIDECTFPEDMINLLQHLPSTSIHKDNIVRYIAGYVVRSLQGKLECENCAQCLLADCVISAEDHQYASLPADSTHRLIAAKNRGGLMSASEAVVSIVHRCEQIITVFVNQQFMAQPNVAKRLLLLFQRSVYEDQPAAFFHHSCDVTEGMLAHQHILTRQVASKYIDIRMKHMSRHFNRLVIENGSGTDRTRLSRLVIFKHQ